MLHYHRVGGSGIVAYEIGRSMAEDRGHEVHFVGMEPPFRFGGTFSERMHFHKVEVKEYPVFDYQPYTLALASQLSELILLHDIDVIHSHYALPHAVAAHLAKEISGKPVKTVATLHGTDITVVGAHPTMRNITCYAIRVSNRVTAVSDSLKEATIKEFGISKNKIRKIYNFVNPKHFNPDLPRVKQLNPKGKKIIIHISNLRPVKSPLDVIEIFYGIQKTIREEMELWVVGEGPLLSAMIARAGELDISNSVKFIGIYSNIGSLLASADCFLLPSKQESFGLAALEAMMCGTPVIATRVGGLPELIDDGSTGFLFDFGRNQEAVDKASELFQNEQLYARIRENGLERARTKYDMTAIVSQYEELYLL